MKHDCEKELYKKIPNADQVQDGRMFACSCGKVYVHVCDEAEGCFWDLVKTGPRIPTSLEPKPASRGGQVPRKMNLDEHDRWDR